MAQTVTMPQLGESVTEGTIARWLKQPGESVERYEAIAEVVTDKVNAEIPAPAEGRMGEHLVEEGAVVPVGAPICTMEAAAASEASSQAAVAQVQPAAAAPVQPPEVEPTRAAAAPQAQPAAAPPAQPEAVPPAQPEAGPGGAPGAEPAGGNGRGLHVTPAVRMLAREHDIDLSRLQGSGLGGRITKKDVLTYVQERGAAATRPLSPAAPAAAPASGPPAGAAAPPPPVAPAPAPPAEPPGAPAAQPPRAPTAAAAPGIGAPAPAPEQLGGDSLVPLSAARRAIAEHMVRSKATSPHAWTMVEVDMSRVVRSRARHRASFEAAVGARLTYLPFVARATVAALRAHPLLNSSYTQEGVLLHRDIHLGIAVALEDSLIVPVLRHADRLSLAGIAQAAADLGERARGGRLRIDELTGGTFTLNNTGALGLVLTAPIINQPQAAILAMDSIVKRPVVSGEDAIAIRSMMNLGISFDHRVIDGLQAARFVGDIKRQLEAWDEAAPLL